MFIFFHPSYFAVDLSNILVSKGIPQLTEANKNRHFSHDWKHEPLLLYLYSDNSDTHVHT